MELRVSCKEGFPSASDLSTVKSPSKWRRFYLVSPFRVYIFVQQITWARSHGFLAQRTLGPWMSARERPRGQTGQSTAAARVGRAPAEGDPAEHRTSTGPARPGNVDWKTHPPPVFANFEDPIAFCAILFQF